ncbi:hypothetical protein GOV03_01760 [Candidatus Woesearchaeota archaeon]|nr:hypothetical protein [Candidatus Woesearchaeota archaeon]
MNVKELKTKINVFFKNSWTLIKEFPAKFKKMGLGEQIAYSCIALGILLIVVSLFLF